MKLIFFANAVAEKKGSRLFSPIAARNFVVVSSFHFFKKEGPFYLSRHQFLLRMRKFVSVCYIIFDD